jgi:hypothetical protein
VKERDKEERKGEKERQKEKERKYTDWKRPGRKRS